MAFTEKRGFLKVAHNAEGKQDYLVLRRQTLRIYDTTTSKRSRGSATNGKSSLIRCSGLPTTVIKLGRWCKVQSQGCDVEISMQHPVACTYSFSAGSAEEAGAWREALEKSFAEEQKIVDGCLKFLEQGCTAYKYNYSNSKRMRRCFWLDVDKVELCWGKSRTEEEPSTMDLRDSVGIIYGPMTTTFQRCSTLEDPGWCCFSILFPDRTLDMAVPLEDQCEKWFFGLQSLLVMNAENNVHPSSYSQFVFRKVFNKFKAASDARPADGQTPVHYLAKKLRALGEDSSFRSALGKVGGANGGGSDKAKGGASAAALLTNSLTAEEAERAAKEERRRRRRESKAQAEAEANGAGAGGYPAPSSRGGGGYPAASSQSPSPTASMSPSPTSAETERRSRRSKAVDGQAASAVNGEGVTNGQAAADEEAELHLHIASLERELEGHTSKLEALRSSWQDKLGSLLPMDGLGEVLRSSSNLAWQAEKCSELEREAMLLRLGNGKMERQLAAAEKAEKQLKKLAKQFKESETQVQRLQEELSCSQEGAQSAEQGKYSSSAELTRAQAQKDHLERRVAELEADLKQANKGQDLAASLKEKNAQQAQELTRLAQEEAGLKQKLDKLSKDNESLDRRQKDNEKRLRASEGTSQRLVESLRQLQKEVGNLQGTNKQIRTDCQTQLRSISDSFPPLNGAVQKIGGSIGNLLDRYREICEERKKLHNLVLELKGNIRVFVRVRPISEKEKMVEVPGEATISFAEDIKIGVFEENTARRKWFDFDQVFSPKTAQAQVFDEVKPLATSVLDGYNVCIFAYGQTGSGKTYTMTGTEENPGLNTNVLKELFSIKEERKVDMDIKISLMITEIYNETIKDLFVTKQKKLDVKTNPDGSNTVPGLTELQVNTVEEVLKSMKEAQANRTVMQTDMNSESSRSHSIVQVKTTMLDRRDKREYHGKINLIDLAGSENVAKSGVSGDGLREAQNINKSLSALGDVIGALIQKSPHVPYRNSKLTMMLKDSLGGDAKTLMIVQCSPAQTNCTETLSSLNFASRARNVELGKAKKNVKEVS
eukprot:TRINITY_DN3914_c0_g4_i2.p1 TRINITY_DN3914_c0_g4~~TRINITY_DN3914_c0_g4_i2.p1  ORF type:complete len:1054 (+),score=362.37 TRINITY_DN3914_c0_g4_i2:145-3306(+)